MTTRHVITSHPRGDEEICGAFGFYDGSSVQGPFYDHDVPAYAGFLAGVIASARPTSVLEFGCNAGRNLDQLRHLLPAARLQELDLNASMVERGRARYGLDFRVGNETALAALPDASQEVVFTVSVVDYIPYLEFTLRHLLRVARHYLVLFEICNGQVGKAGSVLVGEDGGLRTDEGYPYSYLHDYRQECERKFGALCVADLHYPIQSGRLLDLYRLMVFAPRPTDQTTSDVAAFALRPVEGREKTTTFSSDNSNSKGGCP